MNKQNTEKLSEKAFIRLLLVSVIGVLLCIVCLSATTYAWFTGSAEGNHNKIQAADACLLSVTVHKNGVAEALATVNTSTPVTLDVTEGEYTVTLTLPQGSASGYLVIGASGQSYYSAYLQRNETADQELSFTLCAESAQALTLTARWGIYSDDCQVDNGGVLTLR